MGLSNENPKASIETIRVLVDLAKGFELFKEYGLEKLIKDMNALSEIEERKAKTVREDIAKNEALIADLKARQKQIDATSLQQAQTIQTIQDERLKLDNRETALNALKKELDQQAEDNRKAKEAVTERERAVQVGESKLADGLSKLDADRKEASKILADLKKRAEQIQNIAEGS